MKIEKVKITDSDFVSLAKRALDKKLFGISFCSTYFLGHFLDVLKGLNSSVTFINTSVVNEAWIDAHSVQIDLFSEENIFVVLDGSKLSDSLLDRIVNEVEANLIFCDCQKMDKLISKIGGIDLIAPKFWEYGSLATFLAKLHNISLTSVELEAIDLSIEKSIDSYWKLFQQISQFNEKSQKHVIHELIEEQRFFDQFKFVDLLNVKQKNKLLTSLLEVKSFTQLELLCTFLVTHGLKILDPSSLIKKSKLTRFDQSILKASKLWGENELISYLGILKRVSFLCRSKKKEAFIELMKAAV